MHAGTRYVRNALLALAALVVVGLALLGAVTAFKWSRDWVARHRASAATPAAPAPEWMPVSKLPGPARPTAPVRFALTATNAQFMIGMDDPANERWCDVAGNYYAESFVSSYSHEGRGSRHPQVLIHVDPQADTLRGRLEAHRLKPNFAYQVKLRGVFADRRSFEAIGHVGRWRLPGRGTNYSDADYEAYPDKGAVESYILFDYFVTDRNGNAIRELALDSSLHVLWNASRQGGAPERGDLLRAIVLADDPAAYGRPKPTATAEWLWAERESGRYTAPDQRITLPPGQYQAELVLTEESFHAHDNDGGFWATVFRCPVAFTVVPTHP